MQSTRLDIPQQMREFADRSVEEARKAFDQFLDATQKAVADAEGSTRTLTEGAGDVNRKAMVYAQQNIAVSFEFAHRMVQARTVEEIAALQQEFVRQQMEAATKQGKELGEIMGKGAAATAKKAKS